MLGFLINMKINLKKLLPELTKNTIYDLETFSTDKCALFSVSSNKLSII